MEPSFGNWVTLARNLRPIIVFVKIILCLRDCSSICVLLSKINILENYAKQISKNHLFGKMNLIIYSIVLYNDVA